ncbi:MAG TPA: glycerate kinase, partial [Jatrophihabitans sp.]|nr:glycerate kinase [Jatrophihabitans sp.]
VAAATGSDRRNQPGAGAAGGVGFAAVAVLGGTLCPGVDLVLDLMHFAEEVKRADLVVTGEGSLDEQTLRGKAPAGVAAAARAAGVPTIAVAGRATIDAAQLRGAGFEAVHTLVEEASRPDEPFTDPGPLLRRIGARIADRLDVLT